jgi:hypothetical protein
MFRFTIRDVLWLTVVMALAVGWWVEHYRFTRDAGLHHSDLTWQIVGDYGDEKTQEAVVDLVIEHHPTEHVRKRLASDRARFRSPP